jgi:hypothetical protein
LEQKKNSEKCQFPKFFPKVSRELCFHSLTYLFPAANAKEKETGLWKVGPNAIPKLKELHEETKNVLAKLNTTYRF